MVTDICWYIRSPHVSHHSCLLPIVKRGVKAFVTHNSQGRPRPSALSVGFWALATSDFLFKSEFIFSFLVGILSPEFSCLSIQTACYVFWFLLNHLWPQFSRMFWLKQATIRQTLGAQRRLQSPINTRSDEYFLFVFVFSIYFSLFCPWNVSYSCQWWKCRILAM